MALNLVAAATHAQAGIAGPKKGLASTLWLGLKSRPIPNPRPVNQFFM
ncbi:hypothetical protein PJN38_24150 [Mycobacterium kansasii]